MSDEAQWAVLAGLVLISIVYLIWFFWRFLPFFPKRWSEEAPTTMLEIPPWAQTNLYWFGNSWAWVFTLAIVAFFVIMGTFSLLWPAIISSFESLIR